MLATGYQRTPRADKTIRTFFAMRRGAPEGAQADTVEKAAARTVITKRESFMMLVYEVVWGAVNCCIAWPFVRVRAAQPEGLNVKR